MDIATNTQRENEQRVAEEYLSSLSDLNCNSKPLINMLTMLAEENIEYAGVIVKVVEQHINKVPSEFKLPILYLIDSIAKNVKSTYVQLFSQCIVSIFCGTFEKVNEKIRERMYALRQTWNEVFSAQRLYALDVKVKRLDHNWPITAKQPSIHVNPNFLKGNSAQAIPEEMEKILQDKTRELLELRKRKLELELEATKKHLEEQEKQFCKTAEGIMPPVEALVAANSLQTVNIRGPPIAPQMMPAGMMPAGYMGGPTSIAVNPAMRPAMFHPNMRGFRPNLHPSMMNAQGMQAHNMMHSQMMGANANKPKVHPVNSALLNSVRQRDPRLQRQQQQLQQQQQMQNNQNGERSLSQQQQNVRSFQQDKEKHERNYKSSLKPPPRITSNSRSSSSSRSSKNSQRDKNRDRERERDRKRSESKSSAASSSSSGSTTNTERKKGVSNASTSSDKQSSKCDKDAFEIAPLSTAFKRKSTSPSKSRDSKRVNSHKSRHSSRSKTRSRSRSPSDKNSTSPYGDVDLRRTSISSTSSSMIYSPDKRPKVSESDQDITSNNNKEDIKKSTPSPKGEKDLDKSKKCHLYNTIITMSIKKLSLNLTFQNDIEMALLRNLTPQRVVGFKQVACF